MSTTQLTKAEWKPYFDNMSRALKEQQAEIEVNSLQLGSQIEANWAPLLGITYDPRSDVLEVVLEGLDHLIHRQKTIFVEQDDGELKSMEVTDNDDTHQIIRLRDSQRR